MQLFFVLLSALTPVAIALYYIFKKDSAQPEPAKWLTKAFIGAPAKPSVCNMI